MCGNHERKDHSVIRLVTSWATDAVQVDRFVELIMALSMSIIPTVGGVAICSLAN